MKGDADADDRVCMDLALGSDHPQREIPWNESAREFSVTPLEEERGIRLSRGHWYRIRSSQGCGCGFYLDEAAYQVHPDEEVRRERLNQFARLKDYLAEATAGGAVELLVIWCEVNEPVLVREMTVDRFDMADLSPTWHDERTQLFRFVAG